MKISVVIIAKNAEELLVDCIDSVSFANEIVVIDNNSTDRTGEIAKMKHAVVYPYVTDDFSKLRNFALDKATNDWIFYLDADERVTKSLKKEIEENIVSANEYSAFILKRKNYYLGNNQWPGYERMPRIFYKKNFKEWVGKLHETPGFEGKAKELNEYLLHYSHRNLSVMLQKTIEWSRIEAQLRFKSNHPKMVWWRFLRVMITEFIDWYIFKKGYKAGTVGLIESMYQSFSIFITYTQLWEMQIGKK